MALIDDILRLLGTNRVRLRWKWAAAKERFGRAARRAENQSRAVTYGHQACPACGHPADRQETKCPKCGEPLRGAAAFRAGRVLGWLLPAGLPYVSMAIMAACIGLYLVTVKMSQAVLGDEAARFTPSLFSLVRFGASVGSEISRGHEVWRLLTAVFLHFDLTHLAFNMIGVWVVGQAIEERFGRARLLVVWVLSGVAGNVASVWWHEGNVLGAGASGAVFGLIGCALGHALRRRGRAGAELRARFVPWLLWGLVVGLAGRIDNAAHIGGLLLGAALGAVMAERDRARRAPAWVWNVAGALALAAVVGAFVLAAEVAAQPLGGHP